MPKRPASPPAADSAARARLLDAAERLLGEAGLEGASLRQISAAAGHANNSAVQYHFGDKAGLIRAVIARRVEAFEPRRRDMLAALQRDGRDTDIGALLQILFVPIGEVTDSKGRHVYARFLLQFLNQIRYQAGLDHPGWAADSAAMRSVELMAKALPQLGIKRVGTRINRISGLFLSALIERENAAVRGKHRQAEAGFREELFAMMAAALSAPPGTRG